MRAIFTLFFSLFYRKNTKNAIFGPIFASESSIGPPQRPQRPGFTMKETWKHPKNPKNDCENRYLKLMISSEKKKKKLLAKKFLAKKMGKKQTRRFEFFFHFFAAENFWNPVFETRRCVFIFRGFIWKKHGFFYSSTFRFQDKMAAIATATPINQNKPINHRIKIKQLQK
jgi:hypothetical protein